jgi:fatty acid amide hydrolase
MSNRSIDQDSTNTLPELFGIPISLKDTIDIKGMASSIGSTARYDFKQPEDGAIVQVLKKSGMIPFVKSNVPQLAMTFESTNNLWGRATNPWDNTRAVGGSSGGEAALIAGRCSPLGIGSDIGGSVRIPSEFCGVYSFKPSSLRYQ